MANAGWKAAFAALLCVAVCALAAQLTFSSNSAVKPVVLTWYEERTGQPSKQQRWYQWMSHNDAGPMVGGLGQGWDGVDREGMFPGDGPTVLPRYAMDGSLSVMEKARMTSLSQLDQTLNRGSSSYVDAHKYLQQLQQQSVAGQHAYEARKAAKRAALMQKGMKKAEALWANTKKNGYGKSITREEFATIKALKGH
eukprot:CAMPEP_0181320090 /NCGR_PEP_ID=MMETSP1101-20121128/17929_1 /TAXON_ID=46948 /ORGANISM="Rhodomonas abbreviata, Strain Caron Lab Isolate" /LENGTH=195 /DNA_ID=CAMNT_0023427753 /DNA_START=6 /DNA_END=593 /DNA_ORIENTATION=+